MPESNNKILIVEEDEILFKVLSDRLNDAGFDASGAVDGEEGLSAALSQHPDLILLDLKLPKMDGMTLLKKLREDPWGKGVPVVILTNLNPDDAMLKAIVENRPAYYLVKAEWKIEDVINKVKEILTTQ